MVNFFKKAPPIWKFLWAIILLYLSLFIVQPEIVVQSFEKFLFLLQKIAGSFLLVFVFMYLFNLFISEKFIKKNLQKDLTLKHYLIVAFVGIFSSGPVYLWFAHLSDLKKKGVDERLISIFLYNRAIKLPLIPLLISYFSVKIMVIFIFLIFIFSFLNAFFIHFFLKKIRA